MNIFIIIQNILPLSLSLSLLLFYTKKSIFQDTDRRMIRLIRGTSGKWKRRFIRFSLFPGAVLPTKTNEKREEQTRWRQSWNRVGESRQKLPENGGSMETRGKERGENRDGWTERCLADTFHRTASLSFVRTWVPRFLITSTGATTNTGQANKLKTGNLQHDRRDCAPCRAGKRFGRRSSWCPSSLCCRSKAGWRVAPSKKDGAPPLNHRTLPHTLPKSNEHR